MTRATTHYLDAAGRAHATKEAAITADLAALIGSHGTATKLMAKREEVLALLSEMDGDVVRLERKRA